MRKKPVRQSVSNKGVGKLAPGRHHLGDGLYILVSPDGLTRRFIQRYTNPVTRRPNETGLGVWDEFAFTLDDAQDKARANRQLIRQGIDPVQHKKALIKATTPLRPVALEWLELQKQKEGWSDSHYENAKVLVMTHGAPLLNRPVSEIDDAEVRKALAPLMQEHPDQGHRARRMWRNIFALARHQKLRTGDNPADWQGCQEWYLPRLRPSDQHHADMAYERIPVFYPRLCGLDSPAVKALRFLILTVCRTSEVVYATRDEFDMNDPKGPIWTVPRVRTKKKKRDHIVPLSEQAVALIRPLLRSSNSSFVFFDDETSKRLRERSMYELLRTMDDKATVHGYRASFKTWAREETEFAREMVEICLSHKVGDATEEAYWRGTAQKRRRPIMQAWADHCTTPALTLVSSAG